MRCYLKCILHTYSNMLGGPPEITIDSLRQVRQLGVVLLEVYNESVNMFLTYKFYTPKVAVHAINYRIRFLTSLS